MAKVVKQVNGTLGALTGYPPAHFGPPRRNPSNKLGKVKQQGREGEWTFGPGGKYFKPSGGQAVALDGYAANNTLQEVDGHGVRVEASGDAWARDGRWKLLNYSRDFQRNTCLRSIVKVAINYAIRRGLKLQCRTEDKAWARAAERAFNAWWESPEHRQVMSGLALEKAILREFILTGEVWILKTSDGLLQLVEAEQVRGLSWTDNGIITDAKGRPIAYQFKEWDAQSGMLKQEPRTIPAGFVIHVVDPERPSAQRGVPLFQDVFPMLHRLDAVLDSYAISWQMASKIIGARLYAGDEEPGSAAAARQTWDPYQNILESDNAIMFEGLPGDDIKLMDQTIPGRDFPESVRMFFRLVGQPIGLPLESILHDWSQAGSYSATRGTTVQAGMNTEPLQDVVAKAKSEAYLWFVPQAVKRGELTAPPADWQCHSWLRPKWPLIDEVKEIEGKAARINQGLASYGELCAELGLDADEMVEEIKEDVRRAMGAKLELEEEFPGETFDWKMFCGRTTGKTEAAVKEQNPESRSQNPEGEDGNGDGEGNGEEEEDGGKNKKKNTAGEEGDGE